MATVQEQAIEWIHQALKFDEPTEQEIVALVPSIPLELAGMPYCPACESVLCGACGHCHILNVVPFTQPECPNDNDDMGHVLKVNSFGSSRKKVSLLAKDNKTDGRTHTPSIGERFLRGEE